MKPDILDLLRCPFTDSRLFLKDSCESGHEIENGLLINQDGSRRYPITNGIPRFVSSGNYAASFGFQWNRFRRTQLDSYTGVALSRDRFYSTAKWRPEDLKDKMVLDAGCGAGRFTEIALAAGARVVAFDYSNAVDACRENFKGHPNLNIIQADIYKLPFQPFIFDYVYCFGVLQHTPDVKKAFMSLCGQLKHEGRLAVDLYRSFFLYLLWPKYWLRLFTKHLNEEKLFSLVQKYVPILLPFSVAIGRIPFFGKKLRHIIPVMNYDGVYNLSEQQLFEWAILDTFDMFSPAYDNPQTAKEVRRWLIEAGLEYEIEIPRQGLVVGRGRRI